MRPDRGHASDMTVDDHIVFIVDDDLRIREALMELADCTECDPSPLDRRVNMFAAAKPDLPAGPILDVELPDINGLDLQETNRKWRSPARYLYSLATATSPSSVRAIKHGAVDFLTKPFSDENINRPQYIRAISAGI